MEYALFRKILQWKISSNWIVWESSSSKEYGNYTLWYEITWHTSLPLLFENLRCRFKLPAIKTYISNWEQQFTGTGGNSFASGAMRNNEWSRTNWLDEHVVTRSAVYGFFYHKLCRKLNFYEPDDTHRSLKCRENRRLCPPSAIFRTSDKFLKLVLSVQHNLYSPYDVKCFSYKVTCE